MQTEIMKRETLEKEADALAQAQALVISSNEDYQAADAFSVGLLALEQAIKNDFAESKKAAKAAHQKVCDQEAGHLGKIAEARAIIRPKLVAWESKVRDENARRQAELEAKAKKEAEDRAIADAEEAEKAGDKATAEAILAAPVVAAPVVLAPTMPKRKTLIPEAWAARVTNPAIVPDDFWIIDEQKLNALARATKGSIKVAGVEFYDKNKTSN